jgi:hypothetical protein
MWRRVVWKKIDAYVSEEHATFILYPETSSVHSHSSENLKSYKYSNYQVNFVYRITTLIQKMTKPSKNRTEMCCSI